MNEEARKIIWGRDKTSQQIYEELVALYIRTFSVGKLKWKEISPMVSLAIAEYVCRIRKVWISLRSLNRTLCERLTGEEEMGSDKYILNLISIKYRRALCPNDYWPELGQLYMEHRFSKGSRNCISCGAVIWGLNHTIITIAKHEINCFAKIAECKYCRGTYPYAKIRSGWHEEHECLCFPHKCALCDAKYVAPVWDARIRARAHNLETCRMKMLNDILHFTNKDSRSTCAEIVHAAVEKFTIAVKGSLRSKRSTKTGWIAEVLDGLDYGINRAVFLKITSGVVRLTQFKFTL